MALSKKQILKLHNKVPVTGPAKSLNLLKEHNDDCNRKTYTTIQTILQYMFYKPTV